MESIKYWQKQLRAGNYKKLNESTSKLVLGLRTQDYGGTGEDRKFLNNLDEVKTTGLKWLQKAIKNWENGYIENVPEEYAEFGYAQQFKSISDVNFLMKALSQLISNFKLSDEQYAEYEIGDIADNDGTWIFLTNEDYYRNEM